MYELIYILMASLVMIQLLSWSLNTKTNNVSDMRHENKRPLFGDIGYGTTWDLNQLWLSFLNEYGMPIIRYCISMTYAIYLSLTVANVILFIFKFVISGCLMCKSLRDYHNTAQDMLKQKNVEMEDIQLQIKIVNEKRCVRDTEYKEREKQLRHAAQRLRAVRARVRNVIANDETLRRFIEDGAPYPTADELRMQVATQEDEEFILTLLKDLKQEQATLPERHVDKMECGDPVSSVPSETSVYSSVDDGENRQDCRVKIVKVTNVYKVAYLKHYIKQKKLRKANQQAVLKKKIESIKKLMEGWQKSLSMAINSKLLHDTSNPLDLASHEAMGDYSKPTVRESDSDSDLTKHNEAFFDEYSLRWSQDRYRNYGFSYEDDVADASVTKEYYEAQEYEMKYNQHATNTPCECSSSSQNVLFILPEETSSQMAIEEIKDDEYLGECRDNHAV